MSAFVRAVAADRSANDLGEGDLLEAVDVMERVVSDVVGADLGMLTWPVFRWWVVRHDAMAIRLEGPGAPGIDADRP